ncbi:MAG: lysophospholipid acyltransferase family protein [Pseudomonadota bacterium]
MKRRLQRLLQLPFCLYGWLATVIAVVFALLSALLVPPPSWRQSLATFASRLPFILTLTRPTVEGLDNLPQGHSVVVANHASYVDGPLLKGYLPPRFSFVIKGEMRNIPVVHFLLRRAGARFVERNEAGASARDARSIVRAAQDGASLAFFPEGTFRVQPGVGRFRAGAFMAAIKGGTPVVPVTITGTRRMLTCDDWMLRWSRPTIRILPPIPMDDPAYGNHRDLAEAARQRILAMLDEPDLLKNESPGSTA